MHNWCDSLESAGLCDSLPTHNWASHTSGNRLFSRSALYIILKQTVEVQLETWCENEIHAGQNWQKPPNATKTRTWKFSIAGVAADLRCQEKTCFPEGFAFVHLLRLKSALWFVLTYIKWLCHVKHARQLLRFYWERAQSQAYGPCSCRLFFCVNDSRKALLAVLTTEENKHPGKWKCVDWASSSWGELWPGPFPRLFTSIWRNWTLDRWTSFPWADVYLTAWWLWNNPESTRSENGSSQLRPQIPSGRLLAWAAGLSTPRTKRTSLLGVALSAPAGLGSRYPFPSALWVGSHSNRLDQWTSSGDVLGIKTVGETGFL